MIQHNKLINPISLSAWVRNRVVMTLFFFVPYAPPTMRWGFSDMSVIHELSARSRIENLLLDPEPGNRKICSPTSFLHFLPHCQSFFSCYFALFVINSLTKTISFCRLVVMSWSLKFRVQWKKILVLEDKSKSCSSVWGPRLSIRKSRLCIEP